MHENGVHLALAKPRETGRHRRTIRAMVLPAAVVLLATVATGCGSEVGDPAAQDSPPASTAPDPTAVPADPGAATATTLTERTREVLRSRQPLDAETVIALAGSPMSWTTGRGRLLLEYWLTSPRDPDWPDARVVARRVLDRHGRIVAESVQRTRIWWDTWPIGHDFIEADFRYGFTPTSVVLLGRGAATPLTFRRSPRPARPHDVRFGYGWLYDRHTRTVAPELLPLCRQDSARVDTHGRIWCLDHRKTHLLWSDDGRHWTSHALSTTYLDWCDGGARGSDLAISGNSVAIGLWRADVTTDRGTTWHDVPLPYRKVGAHRGPYPNCTGVEPLPDGRLVISYFGTLIASDPTNTHFQALGTPAHTSYAGAFAYPRGIHEGVLLAVGPRPTGIRRISYDAGRTWHPVRVASLLHHLLPLPRAAGSPSSR
jgi:hypothetical protein